jgi:BirA family biotin operon repressor/biotin-[acetyl-CoA-carboxylase] ligase
METLFIGKSLHFLHEVESTNTYAMNLLRNVNPIEGTVIHTDHQTKGKGQRGAVWASKMGQNVTMSVILKPTFLIQNRSFYLSKIAALALYDVLTDIDAKGQYDIKIKWPNDILINQKKIAGILIENNLSDKSFQYSVIGIGFNVNQTEFDGLLNATSLSFAFGKNFERLSVMMHIWAKLEKWYLKLKEGRMDLIDETYLKCLLGLNQLLDFEDSNGYRFAAIPKSVTTQGKLILLMPDNEERDFDIKELKFLLGS